jgi:hypothetical protein
MKDYVPTPIQTRLQMQRSRPLILSKGSIGEAVRQGTTFLHKVTQLIPAECLKIKMGRAERPVQELRFLSGSSCDLRSLADRFLRTADPQVLISEKE